MSDKNPHLWYKVKCAVCRHSRGAHNVRYGRCYAEDGRTKDGLCKCRGFSEAVRDEREGT